MSPGPLRIAPLRIAIDTGGTFTDCAWVEGGRLRLLKVFSTPADPSQAIVNALRKIGHRGDWVLLHGTTVGTNTLLQRKGARVMERTGFSYDFCFRALRTLKLIRWATQNDQGSWAIGPKMLRFSESFHRYCLTVMEGESSEGSELKI